ncbi:MAG: diacylglycerol kinase family protein [Desulfobacteraceae bacterium]|nr:diacylglycerol kinase family protein [Desulfobacteraceae bacterium]
MNIALIVNPCSGGCSVDAALPAVHAGLRRRGIAYRLYRTRSAVEAAQIMRKLDLRACDALVSMGGDGTNYQLLNALLRADENRRLPPLGIIPCGRGNSFARDLGLGSVEDGLDALAGGRLQPVDVCRFTQPDGPAYFVNLMGLGFVTDVAVTAARLPWLGDAGYAVGVFHRVLGLKPHRLMLAVDGQSVTADNCFVEVCNSRFTGGAMCMAPGARLDDGFFDVVLLAPLSRLKLIASFPRIYQGTHGSLKEIRFIRARRATIATAPVKRLLPDGEVLGVTPTQVDILPRRVTYFCLP